MDEKGKTALWEEYSQTKDPKIREKLILQYSVSFFSQDNLLYKK